MSRFQSHAQTSTTNSYNEYLVVSVFLRQLPPKHPSTTLFSLISPPTITPHKSSASHIATAASQRVTRNRKWGVMGKLLLSAAGCEGITKVPVAPSVQTHPDTSVGHASEWIAINFSGTLGRCLTGHVRLGYANEAIFCFAPQPRLRLWIFCVGIHAFMQPDPRLWPRACCENAPIVYTASRSWLVRHFEPSAYAANQLCRASRGWNEREQVDRGGGRVKVSDSLTREYFCPHLSQPKPHKCFQGDSWSQKTQSRTGPCLSPILRLSEWCWDLIVRPKLKHDWQFYTKMLLLILHKNLIVNQILKYDVSSTRRSCCLTKVWLHFDTWTDNTINLLV